MEEDRDASKAEMRIVRENTHESKTSQLHGGMKATYANAAHTFKRCLPE